jgi:hypothetical protein
VQVADAIFDAVHTRGSASRRSAIYRCTGCGKEVVSEEGKPLPPQNHHTHSRALPIRWRLQVYAQHQGS